MLQWLYELQSRKLYNSQHNSCAFQSLIVYLILNADLNITTLCTSRALLLRSKAKQNTSRVIENEHARI